LKILNKVREGTLQRVKFFDNSFDVCCCMVGPGFSRSLNVTQMAMHDLGLLFLIDKNNGLVFYVLLPILSGTFVEKCKKNHTILHPC